jgi:hypothetical protein
VNAVIIGAVNILEGKRLEVYRVQGLWLWGLHFVLS